MCVMGKKHTYVACPSTPVWVTGDNRRICCSDLKYDIEQYYGIMVPGYIFTLSTSMQSTDVQFARLERGNGHGNDRHFVAMAAMQFTLQQGKLQGFLEH